MLRTSPTAAAAVTRKTLMPEILTQLDARRAQKFPFCFLCAESFDPNDPERINNPDHIPPKKLFATRDRNFPLKVAAHRRCNNRYSDQDEVINQLVAAVHGTFPNQERVRLTATIVEDQITGEQFPGISGTSVEHHVIRWVRGFHAALYHEFLPDQPSTNFCVSLPFPCLLKGLQGQRVAAGLLQNHLDLVAEIKKNRTAGRLDRIQCNNGQCLYECVWSQTDDGKALCVFALKLYDWAKLADPRLSRESCVGAYLPISGRPERGTQVTMLEIPVRSTNRLDAFA
jgi:hypothetical protein